VRDFEDFSPELDSQYGGTVFNRICSAFIESVDDENGTVALSFEDFIGTRGNVELPFAYISSIGPGWFRFMPSIGDRVLVGFRPNDTVEILTYKAVSYPELAQRSADANPPFIFRKLRSGEFELMSKGYAEIWGSKAGKLHLAGGLAFIDLERTSNSIVYNALMHAAKSEGSEHRFGSVRRANPFKTTEDESALVPGLADKEVKTTLVQSIAGISMKLYEATIGKVLDYTAGIPAGIFTPRLHPNSGQKLTADINIYTADGIQSVRFRTDELGNARVDLPATAVDGFRLLMALGQFTLEALKVQVTATTEVQLTGTTKAELASPVVANVTAPQVNLGTAPNLSVGLGEPIEARLAALELALNTFVTTYNAHLASPTNSPASPAIPVIPPVTPTGSLTVKVTP
jgi:hypothetical protein